MRHETDVVPLAEVCEAHAPPVIHFLNIDCEGDEHAEALSGDQPVLWKSDTQGNDEVIIAGVSWPLWRRVTVGIVELWRIRKSKEALSAFLDKAADMPNRQMDGKPVSVEDVAHYLAGEDGAHGDLYLWR